jgi:hypothetical protein
LGKNVSPRGLSSPLVTGATVDALAAPIRALKARTQTLASARTNFLIVIPPLPKHRIEIGVVGLDIIRRDGVGGKLRLRYVGAFRLADVDSEKHTRAYGTHIGFPGAS